MNQNELDAAASSPGSEPPSETPKAAADAPSAEAKTETPEAGAGSGDGERFEDIVGGRGREAVTPPEDQVLDRLDRVVRECDREADHLRLELREMWTWIRESASRVPDLWRRWPRTRRGPRPTPGRNGDLGRAPGPKGPESPEASWRRFAEESGDAEASRTSWEEVSRRYPHLARLLSEWPRSTFRAKVGIASLLYQSLSTQFEEWGRGPYRGIRSRHEEKKK